MAQMAEIAMQIKPADNARIKNVLSWLLDGDEIIRLPLDMVGESVGESRVTMGLITVVGATLIWLRLVTPNSAAASFKFVSKFPLAMALVNWDVKTVYVAALSAAEVDW